ncbi:class I SAM-dependent methyltransferase [Candidatus Woesearchaeota archaeon]|nr:class I SAM-dependent methyltransferase [Candidatus Woesearchaeota archaeon]
MSASYDYRPFAELSPSSKAAVSGLLGYMLMQRKVGSEEASAYYSFISQSVDVSGFFRACSGQFEKAWRKQRTADMLGLAENQNPEVVIDAGCGTGVSSGMILAKLKPARMALVEPVSQALELAKEHLANISIGDCNIDYHNCRVEDLQKIPGLPKADIVLMRSVMRYVRLADYGRVFACANAALKPGGELIFDLPLKLQGEWLSEEDSPYSLVAEVMHEAFDIPALIESVRNASNPATVAGYVDKELKSAGFSVVEQKHFSTKTTLADGYNLIDTALGDVYDGMRMFHPKAYLELSIHRDFIMEKLRAKINELFKSSEASGGVWLGLDVFRAATIN